MENNSLYNKKSYTGRTLFSIVIIVLLATLPFHYVLKDTIMNSGTDPLGNSMKTVDKYADFRVFPKENFTFNNTFVFQEDIDRLITRYNNASVFERQSIREEPLVRKLMEKGIIREESEVNSERTNNYGTNEYNTNSYSSNREEYSEQSYSEEIVSVTAKELYSDYEENEIAADKKYKNKILQVEGTTYKIHSDEEGILIPLVGKVFYGASFCVYCYFSNEFNDEISQIKQGQTITIQGRCVGKDYGGPKLTNCSIIYE